MWRSSILRKLPQRWEMQKNGREGMWAPSTLWEWVYKKSPVSLKTAMLQSIGALESTEFFCSASCAVFKNHTHSWKGIKEAQTNFRALQTSLVQGWHRPGFQPGAFSQWSSYINSEKPCPLGNGNMTFHLGLTSPYSCYCFSSICSFSYTIRAVNTSSRCFDIPVDVLHFFWHP